MGSHNSNLSSDAHPDAAMFRAAIRDLARIGETLGLDPDAGGAGPILYAIEQLRATQPQQDEKAQAVLEAAREWWGERALRDWSEIRLAKALAEYDGDWPGCEGCDFECGENCVPATVAEIHAAIDHQTADLIQAGILYGYEGWTPPSGWEPSEARTRALQPKVRYVPAPQTPAARDVLAERRRQIEAEGWTPEHDDSNPQGDMARAAACYALVAADYPTNDVAILRFWPWFGGWWKPSDRRRNLVKAGALILAEIERLDRAAARAAKGE